VLRGEKASYGAQARELSREEAALD